MRTWGPDRSFYQLLTAQDQGSPGRTARLWRLAEPIGVVVYQKVGLGMHRARVNVDGAWAAAALFMTGLLTLRR